MQKLTVQQLLGIALFGIVDSWENCDKSKVDVFNWTKSFRSAIINAAVDKFVVKDWRGLRSLLKPLLSDKDGNDLSSVTMIFALTSASSCYRHVIEVFSEKESNKQHLNRLFPVIPIKFCRCCVKVEVKLFKCRICVENFDFPDVHWFCSDDCNEKALADGHLKEHDLHLMKKCGLLPKRLC
jgi:hypothetical protein